MRIHYTIYIDFSHCNLNLTSSSKFNHSKTHNSKIPKIQDNEKIMTRWKKQIAYKRILTRLRSALTQETL